MFISLSPNLEKKYHSTPATTSNYSTGLSFGYGRTLDTIGYKLRDPFAKELRLVGTDFTFLRNRFEHRFDLFYGKWLGEDTIAMMYRLGVLLHPEGRLKK